MTLDQLGKMQPDTRNPFLVNAMETLSKTENRYSGIPRIRRAMADAGLREPLFEDARGEFSVTLYNDRQAISHSGTRKSGDDKGVLEFCAVPRTRKELADFLGLASAQYALKRYVEPLVKSGELLLSIPDRPRSPKQTYTTANK